MIHYLNNTYQQDYSNILEWFSEDIKQRVGHTGIIGGMLPRIRATWGLEDEIEFVRDIYGAGLSIEYISIFWVDAGMRTLPWSQKIRTKPYTPNDVFFDSSLPDRKCLLVIGEGGVIQWIDGNVTDSTRKNTFPISETSRITGSFVCPVDRPMYFNNVKNNNTLFMIHVGFEGNPSYEEVLEKLG